MKKIVVDHVRKVRVLFMGMWRRGDFLGIFNEKC